MVSDGTIQLILENLEINLINKNHFDCVMNLADKYEACVLGVTIFSELDFNELYQYIICS